MSQVINKGFQAHGATVSIASGAASAHTAVAPAGAHRTLRVVVTGTVDVFLRAGTGTQTAVNTDLPVLKNTTFYMDFQPEWNDVAIIASGTGSTVYLTLGEGQG
jgi:hypothetical protein